MNISIMSHSKLLNSDFEQKILQRPLSSIFKKQSK